MNETDELLLDLCRQKNGRAFECLFKRYWILVYRVLFTLVGNKEEAEDLAQETFLALYDRPPSSDTGASLGAWLRRVALNRGYNALRDGKRHRQRLTSCMVTVAPDGPHEEAVRSEETAQVRAALMRLSPRQRDILVLRYSGLSYQEIATVLNVAPSSVGTLLARAERSFVQAYDPLPDVERRLDARIL